MNSSPYFSVSTISSWKFGLLTLQPAGPGSHGGPLNLNAPALPDIHIGSQLHTNTSAYPYSNRDLGSHFFDL